MKTLTFCIAILALSLQGLFVAAAEHYIADEKTSSSKNRDAEKVMCSGHHCHEDASCTAIGPGLFECKCNGDLIGDGITSCNGPHGPKDVSNIMEVKRSLKKTKKKKPTGDEDDE